MNFVEIHCSSEVIFLPNFRGKLFPVKLIGAVEYKNYKFPNGTQQRDRNEGLWNVTANLDLNMFFKESRPIYQFISCRLEFMDCRRNWKMVRTPMGYCLEMNASEYTSTHSTHTAGHENEKLPDKLRTLGFTMGFNSSDTTYGWNGYMNGLTIYYMHPAEKYQADEHSYPLVPGLTPIVFLQNIQIKLLGAPYTQCNKQVAYSERSCELHMLLQRYQSKCGCYPSYVGQVNRSLVTADPCTFKQHATCLSLVRDSYRKDHNECFPGCYHETVHQESIIRRRTSST